MTFYTCTTNDNNLLHHCQCLLTHSGQNKGNRINILKSGVAYS